MKEDWMLEKQVSGRCLVHFRNGKQPMIFYEFVLVP